MPAVPPEAEEPQARVEQAPARSGRIAVRKAARADASLHVVESRGTADEGSEVASTADEDDAPSGAHAVDGRGIAGMLTRTGSPSAAGGPARHAHAVAVELDSAPANESVDDGTSAAGSPARAAAKAHEEASPRTTVAAAADPVVAAEVGARGAATAARPPSVPPASLRRPPLLASEALMEDLAPVEPARRDARKWCVGVGAGFMIFGALPLAHLRPGGVEAAVPSLTAGVIALVAGLATVTYKQRAFAMVVLGVLSGVVGLHGSGALLTSSVGGMGWGLARMIAAVALAAALYFRARYRAYAGARVFLAAAFALSVPFVVHTCLELSGAFGVGQVGSLVALAAIAVSLAGFMGAETTGAMYGPAPVVLTAFAIELSLRALWSPGATRSIPSVVEVATAGIAFGGASALASIGVFQILAWRFAADARRIDLHSPAVAAPKNDPASDWSTRD